jgi:hypothetical protein
VYDVPERGGTPPVATALSDALGGFSVSVGHGTYYVVAKLNRTGAPPLLSKLPPDPVTVSSGIAEAGELVLAPEPGEELPPPDSGVSGMVTADGKPTPGAVVYLYSRTDEGLKGPTHKAFGRTGMDGGFRMDAPPGIYYVVARKRFDASSSGELRAGDLSGEYESKGLAAISGMVTDPDGNPLRGVHVFAYTDYKMMGKPQFKSPSTGDDGTYLLTFDHTGKYFIGARDSVGGPMEPGDMVGVYDGTDDNSVILEPGDSLEDIDIVLKEVQ